MIRSALFLLFVGLFLALPAQAEVARVKSGEHADFTRLVIEAPGVEDWSLGRRIDGYELRLDSPNWRYDVSGVFDLIPRTRLASISGDPQTGRLRLGIACACHAIPFEFRPGLIVIDLHNGPPPKGSAFELALDTPDETIASSLTPLYGRGEEGASDLPRASSPTSYNWLDTEVDRSNSVTLTAPPTSVALAAEGESLDPLRQALLAQMSIGLSNGIIDLAEPDQRPEATAGAARDTGWSRIMLGEPAGITTNLRAPQSPPLTPAGAECFRDERLALYEWGSDENVSGTFAETRQSLLGEFDRPDPNELVRAAKSLLYLGFGAEVGQLLRSFPVEGEHPDLSLLASLARLVDGRTDPGGAFAGMERCESTAALWAALSSDLPLEPGTVNEEALRRGFSALPPHLRQALGPGLIDRFLAAQNLKAVTALRSAMERSGPGDDPFGTTLDARIDLAGGQAEAAEARAVKVLAEAGPATAEAIIALVDAQMMQTRPVDPETVTALEALLEEQAGTDRDPDLRRALVLARFGAGDVDGAFAALADAPWVEGELWALLAERGGDGDLLNHAVLPDGTTPEVTETTAVRIAERLLDAGFADQALGWLGNPDPEWDDARHLLRGRALLALGQPEEALAAAAGRSAEEAALLRARAMSDLGQHGAAAAILEREDAQEQAAVALGLAADWNGLASAGPAAWQTAAERLTAGRMPTIAPEDAGALARGASLLGDSEADRASIEALLQTVPTPATQP